MRFNSKTVEMNLLKDEAFNNGLNILDENISLSRLRRLLDTNNKIDLSTKLVYLDVMSKYEDFGDENESLDIMYGLYDEYDIYHSFFNGMYEMTYLPLDDIGIYMIESDSSKEVAKADGLYFTSRPKNLLYRKNFLLFYKSKLEEYLKDNSFLLFDKDVYDEDGEIVRFKKCKVLSRK